MPGCRRFSIIGGAANPVLDFFVAAIVRANQKRG